MMVSLIISFDSIKSSFFKTERPNIIVVNIPTLQAV
jgi:hypothetical protein